MKKTPEYGDKMHTTVSVRCGADNDREQMAAAVSFWISNSVENPVAARISRIPLFIRTD